MDRKGPFHKAKLAYLVFLNNRHEISLRTGVSEEWSVGGIDEGKKEQGNSGRELSEKPFSLKHLRHLLAIGKD
jgi:hypothetical protein